MSRDLTSRRQFLEVARSAAGAAVFGSGIALDSAALAPKCVAPVTSQSETTPPDYTLHIGASPVEIAPKRILSTITYNGQFHGKFVLTDDRSMIDWGALGAPRRVDGDDLDRQPQTGLQHRRISLCPRPAVREEEVAMVRADA